MNVRNPVNQKHVVDFNIRNVNHASKLLIKLSRAALFLEKEQPKKALILLQEKPSNIHPALIHFDYFDLLGRSYQNLGQFNNSRRAFQKAFGYSLRLKDKERCRLVAQSLGDVNRQLENFSSAKKWYGAASQFSRSNSQNAFDAKIGMALSLRGIGNYKKAILWFRQLCKDYSSIKDKPGMAYAYWSMGTTERFAGHLKNAEKHLRKSIQIYNGLNDKNGLAYAWCALGGTLRMRGFPEESLILYRKAFKYFTTDSDKFGLAYSSCGQSNALRLQHQSQKSLIFMQKAEDLYRSLHQKGPLAFVLWSKAQWEMEFGECRKAKIYLNEATRLFSKVKDSRGLIYCQLGFAQLNKKLSRASLAQSAFKTVSSNSKKHGLILEWAHAESVLFPLKKKLFYTKAEVFWPGFSRYTATP